MRVARLIIVIIIVLVSLGLLLYAGSRAAALSCISRLERGERGIVAYMLEKGMVQELEDYHNRQIETLEIKLPQAPGYALPATYPPAERFYYVDARGTVMIKGLSDKNTPEDLSQKCLLFADSRLDWYQARLLLEAFLGENIRNVYLAGLAPDGRMTYTPVEITPPGLFMVYPYIICLLSGNRSFYYYRDEEELVNFSGLEAFKKAVLAARNISPVESPFLRLVAAYEVTVGEFHSTLCMFGHGGVRALTMPNSDDRIDILAEVTELSQPPEQEEEEEK
jgi:hypothetical protein